MDIYVYGTHAVLEALESPERVLSRVFIAPSRKDREIERRAHAAHIPVAVLDEARMPEGVDRNAVHQGVVGLITESRLMRPYETFMQSCTPGSNTAFVLLGEVQDPHNVGAIIRSAAAFGAAAVLIPKHNQAPVTGTVIKVSAGMAFRVPLVAVGNVNTTLRDLKERGFWVYGLAGDGEHSVYTETFDHPAVFVVGNEGKGMRLKTREACDIELSIPMDPRCESLNVSVATAVVLSSWSRYRGNVNRA